LNNTKQKANGKRTEGDKRGGRKEDRKGKQRDMERQFLIFMTKT